MDSPGLNKFNLTIEKGRTAAMVFGGICAFLFVLTYLYLLAVYIMEFEFYIAPYEYLPFIRIDTIRKILVWLVFLPLLLNSSAVKKVEMRLAAIGSLVLTVGIKNLLAGGTANMWVWVGLSVLHLLLELIFLGLTFKANKFMNGFMMFWVILRIFNVVFVILNNLIALYQYIPFSTYYISAGTGLLYYFFLMIYLFTLTHRSTTVKENLEKWKTGTSTQPEMGSSDSTIMPVSSPSSQGTFFPTTKSAPPLQGDEVYAIPRAVFWCSTCNQQQKVQLKAENMYTANPCPRCGKPLLAWWNKGLKAKYYRFIAGLTFMAGGMFTIMIENMLDEGLIPVIIMMVLGLIYTAVFLVLFIPTLKLKVSGPSSDAAPVLPKGVYERFVPEMLKVVGIAAVGGLMLFGIARAITGIALGIF